METFEAAVALRLMEDEGITVWNGVDAMAVPMLAHPDLARRDRSRLRTGGFAATGGGVQGLFEAVVERLGVRLAFQPYGMTEVNAMALVHDLDESPESLAVAGVWPADGLEARVVDPATGREHPIDGERELWLRGRLAPPGYYHNPEDTPRALRADGWFKTTTWRCHADGRVVSAAACAGAAHQPLHGGPREIEAYLQTHPQGATGLWDRRARPAHLRPR
jgi:fatty-acyl-CoA synthase